MGSPGYTGVRGGQQTAGAIAGVVKDDTGGVLPGVTVEASSPALIEKTRSVVSDDIGRYQITDLRPGTYEVTFTLPGFSVVRRSGIVLTTGFTANINADLKVGNVEETITVTGDTPVVDVQNVKQSAVMSREILDTIPAGGQVQNIGILIPGASAAHAPTGQAATRDVGGLNGQAQIGLASTAAAARTNSSKSTGFRPTTGCSSRPAAIRLWRPTFKNMCSTRATTPPKPKPAACASI